MRRLKGSSRPTIESYLADGRKISQNSLMSDYDPCLGWENTVALVEEIYTTLTK